MATNVKSKWESIFPNWIASAGTREIVFVFTLLAVYSNMGHGHQPGCGMSPAGDSCRPGIS
eukprot:6750553-Ditylum_brightwellii.AAC.1